MSMWLHPPPPPPPNACKEVTNMETRIEAPSQEDPVDLEDWDGAYIKGSLTALPKQEVQQLIAHLKFINIWGGTAPQVSQATTEVEAVMANTGMQGKQNPAPYHTIHW